MHRQIVILGDGRRIPVYVINFGYSEERGGYLTLFVHARSAASAGSLFECAPKRRTFAPIQRPVWRRICRCWKFSLNANSAPTFRIWLRK